jgi:uncharacterized protein
LARIAFTTEPILSRNTAIAFEFGLAAIALGVGWLVGFSPLRSLPFESGLQTLAHIGWGLGCVLPMLGMLCLIELSRWRPLIQLRDDVREIIRSIFGDASWFELALLAAAAGVGEELLFRGLLQGGLAHWIGGPSGPVISLVVVSLLFGACHWVTPTYAALASVAGLFLGAMFLVFDHLGPPIVTHAVYDFLALLYLLRERTPSESTAD